jgi:hypothetical protein
VSTGGSWLDELSLTSSSRSDGVAAFDTSGWVVTQGRAQGTPPAADGAIAPELLTQRPQLAGAGWLLGLALAGAALWALARKG